MLKTYSNRRDPIYACSESLSEISTREDKIHKTKITFKNKFIIFMVAFLFFVNLVNSIFK